MYLDTANSEEIEAAIHFPWVKGVTTNPTLLLKEKRERMESLETIHSIIGEKRLFIQVQGETPYELEQDAYSILDRFTGNHVSLKIQADQLGIDLMSRLKAESEEVDILATVIFSVDQAFLSGLAGADWIAPYVNRMTNASIDPYAVIKKAKKLFVDKDLDTQIMGASFKNQTQIIDALYHGADTATVPVELLQGMMNNKMAQESILTFNEHAKTLA